MDTIINALTQIDAVVWGPAMICLLLGSHIFLTIRTGFIQRKLPTAIKMSLAKDEDAEGDVSQFGALVTALAGTIGTGSIVGVATAIIAGGPGAVFWMWLTGVFGIATKYCEVFASVKYRVKDHKGEMLGGAMYAWERAFKRPDGSGPGGPSLERLRLPPSPLSPPSARAPQCSRLPLPASSSRAFRAFPIGLSRS